jgi:hypothetical protein
MERVQLRPLFDGNRIVGVVQFRATSRDQLVFAKRSMQRPIASLLVIGRIIKKLTTYCNAVYMYNLFLKC